MTDKYYGRPVLLVIAKYNEFISFFKIMILSVNEVKPSPDCMSSNESVPRVDLS